MSSQPVEANVVLTTDNSQYDQAMMTSGQSTDALGKSLDSLNQKLNQLSKSAGKKLLTFTAADVALIGGATAAWSSYEKQVSRLQSQSAILSRTSDQQNRTMKDYAGAVKGLRNEFGTTTSEAAKLVTTLAKVTGLRQSRDLGELSKVFVEMSHATGESSEGLASSLTNLQKVMGTEINSKNARQYADTFTYLSSQTNASATQLADFTAQLAPMGRSIGMNTKEVAGFATAFTRAGAEGMGASSTFTKITGDIAKSLASGSPEIAHYANLIGVTNERFKELGGKEQVVRILESIMKMGPQAATELNRLGLDGTRSFRQIQAVINEKGGIREALGMAEDPQAKGSSGRGAKASMESLNDEYDELRENLKQTAEAMGSYFMPVMEAFVGGMVKASQAIENLAEGPLGKFAGLMMEALAPLAGGVGMMLLFAGALLKIAAAFTVLRNSGTRGLMEGMRGGSRIIQGPDGRYMAAGAGTLGVRGAQIAERGSWFQRGLYNTGQAIGAPLQTIAGGTREGYMRGRELADKNYQRPEVRRGPFSYMAGGIGRGIEMFGTPLWDQMRYDDPAKRTPVLKQQAPWASMREIGNMSRAMGQAGLAQAQYSAQKTETARIHADPMLTNAQRKAALDNVRQLRQETMERLNTSRVAETTARDEIIAKRNNTSETNKNTTGFSRLGRAITGFGGGMLGGMYGAGKTGFMAARQSGMLGQAGGMAATVAGGAMGSNMLMMGGTGAMLGSMVAPGIGTAIGGGIGTIAGAAMDASAANNDLAESIKNLDDQASAISKSGSGISEYSDAMAKHGDDVYKFKKSVGEAGDIDEFWNGAPTLEKFKTALPTVKNKIEGLFGSSDVEEAEKASGKREKKGENYEAVARDLARAGGVKLSGTERNQRKQLDEFMSTQGAQMLSDAGVDFSDLTRSRGAAGKGPTYQAYFGRVKDQPLDSTVEDRVRGTAGGAMMMDDDAVKKSVRLQSDVGAFYDATNHLFTKMKESGMSNLDIMRDMEKTQQNIGEENNRRYEIALQVSAKAQQALAAQAPGLGRAGAFQQQIEIGKTVMAIKPKTEEQAAQVEQQKATTVQAFQDQDQYFRQLILAQRAYERNRARAQEDYSIQRSYQEYDYQLSRERAEESFNRNRARAVADYYRSVRRAHYDFNLQRRRQEQDFDHQVQVMTKQQAMSVMNIYERVQAQRTSSANWLLSNAGDQLKRMEEQAANLDKLRKMGVSTDVIQQMKLTDPQNAQQLARFVTELTPQMIRQFNKVAGTQRLKAAKELVTDPSSLEWREMVRSHRQSMDRAAQDMRRTMKLGREDFKRGLKEMDEDFDIAMEDQAEDYVTNMNRQERAYKRTMDQAAEDMGHMADEVLGSITKVLKTASTELTGAAKQQAKQAVQAFKDLRDDTTPEAVALMKELSQVFGFQYTNPLKGKGGGGGGGGRATGNDNHANDMAGGPSGNDNHANDMAGRAEGGVIPGWTPGRDTVKVPVSGGEAVMRPEWARAVGKERIDEWNHQARHGGFWLGGTIPLAGASVSRHGSASYYNYAADLNYPGRADYGKPIRAWKSGVAHPFDLGSDRSYGRGQTISHGGQSTLYAHMSKVITSLAGKHVNAGQVIGYVGDYGNTGSPPTSHLHFEIRGGKVVLSDSGTGSRGGGGGMTRQQLTASVLKDLYPKAERAAKRMDGVHPLFPGDISKIINRLARRKIRQMIGKYGLPGGGSGLGSGPAGPAPKNVHGNMALVRRAMHDAGWNQWNALYDLIMGESGFDNLAQNPNSSAFGIFQFLDGTWAGTGIRKTSDPWKQSVAGMRYIRNRYDNPIKANAFKHSHGWYGDGAVFDKAQTIGVGEKGPEAVIPLNDRGANFMTEVMAKTMGGRNVTPVQGSSNVFNTAIDRSTNFTGPITVKANNPHELIQNLKARQRVMALSRPSLTGSAA